MAVLVNHVSSVQLLFTLPAQPQSRTQAIIPLPPVQTVGSINAKKLWGMSKSIVPSSQQVRGEIARLKVNSRPGFDQTGGDLLIIASGNGPLGMATQKTNF